MEEGELTKRFPGEKNLENHKYSPIFDAEWDLYFKKDEGLEIIDEFYHTTNDGNPSFSCK